MEKCFKKLIHEQLSLIPLTSGRLKTYINIPQTTYMSRSITKNTFNEGSHVLFIRRPAYPDTTKLFGSLVFNLLEQN